MRKLIFSCAIFLVGFSCAHQADKSADTESTFKHPDEIVNPNGDSELALVMRFFHFEAKKVSDQIKAGEEVDVAELRRLAIELTTAVPTDSSVLDQDYYNFSESILSQVDRISQGETFEFNGMVQTCVACHRNTCPGPISKIEKLTIES